MSEPQPAAPPPLPRPPRRRPPDLQAAPANLNSVAQTLRMAREATGQSVQEIADILKIRRLYLQAVEDSDWPNLPELVYAQGFVRSYAAYLGLDGAATALQFKREFRGGPRRPELDMPQPIDDNQTPSFKIIGGVIIGLFLIYILWATGHPRQKPETVPPAPLEATVPETQVQPTPTAAAPVVSTFPTTAQVSTTTTARSAVPAPAATQPATTPHPPQTGIAYGAPTATRVTITAVQDSWLQVRAADGQVVFSRVMRPGDYYRVPSDAGLTLTTGNLSGLNFDIDSQNITPSGAPGTVLRNVPLTPENLSQTLGTMTKPNVSQ